MNSLIKKYNFPCPRYTSYPTVPYWDQEGKPESDWHELVKDAYGRYSSEGLSLYIHLPYCESLCTYCGCNTRITVNHNVERPYIDTLLIEWKKYLSLFGEKPILKELHLGGGTPTFFSANNLAYLIEEIKSQCVVAEDAEFSFEAHPANTTFGHLYKLFQQGFKRLSLGIQDFNPDVQDMINRKQSPEQVKRVVDEARSLGYTSINFDIIYGLPLQTEDSVRETIVQVNELRPDRIAYYSYAHVPWMKPGQRKYTEKDLPNNEVKRRLYEIGREIFLNEGYVEIGMDHFAMPEEELAVAKKEGKLHRNFMGYTTTQTKLLIGLGTSAISDVWLGFWQNAKKVEDYWEAVEKEGDIISKGHFLTSEDLRVRELILALMCHYEVTLKEGERLMDLVQQPYWDTLFEDELVEVVGQTIRITEKGFPFVRNICLAFDSKYWQKQPDKQLFSQAI